MLSTLSLLTAMTLPAHAERYAFDDTTGAVGYHMVATLHEIDGQAPNFSGELFIGKGGDHTGTLTVQTPAMTTGLSVRDDRMHEYVLAVTEYPTLTFKMGAIGGDVAGLDSGQGSGQVLLRGQLTIRTSTRDVEIPATYTWQGDKVVLEGRYDMKWTSFGLPDPSIMISTLYPDMTVNFKVTARPAP
ncbi:MAG: YceI family protein [Alphaproteobacteria bacterium]|nr:YceI family protein [Alphaproteobacteria bacterium]